MIDQSHQVEKIHHIQSLKVRSLLEIKILKIIKKYNIIIIHSHFGKNTVRFSVLIKLIFGGSIKIIRHWRSTPNIILLENIGARINFVKKIKKILGPIFWRIIYKFVDYNFVNARIIMKFIEENKIAKLNKVELLENSIDLKRFDYNKVKSRRNKYNIDVNKVVIGSIVNFRLEKDILTLIKIPPLILDKHKDVIFVFAGDGPLRPELQESVRKYVIQKKIIFTGYVSEMEQLIASCDIIIISNHAVGISNAHLEVMAMGKPIVTFNSGELEFLVEDGVNGFLVNKGDIQTFIERIEIMIKNKKLAENLGKNALKKIQKEYNIEKWAERVWNKYFEIVS